jgi:hypothetical protein
LEKGDIVRDCKVIERLRIIKEGGGISHNGIALNK